MATSSFFKFNQFVEDRNHGVHDFSSDQLTVALTNTQPVAGNSVLADITEISYTNLSSRNLTITSSGQTSGTYKLVIQDHTLTASGSVPDFQYVVVYNNTPTTPADPLIFWLEYPSVISMSNNESFDIDFSDANGAFQDS